MIRADLHNHTLASHGTASAGAMVAAARAAGRAVDISAEDFEDADS